MLLYLATPCPQIIMIVIPQEMLSDANPMVVANALAALQVGGGVAWRVAAGWATRGVASLERGVHEWCRMGGRQRDHPTHPPMLKPPGSSHPLCPANEAWLCLA